MHHARCLSARRSRPIVLGLSIVVAATVLTGCLTGGQSAGLNAMNADRTASNLRALPIHGAAQRKAQAWADHMAATSTVSHSDLVAGFGGAKVCSVGENVGSGPTVAAIEKAYMASPTHRSNILGTK